MADCGRALLQGLFATLSGALASTFVGLWFGAVLLTLTSHRTRLKSWAYASVLLSELGLALHVTGAVPLNKNLCAAFVSLLTSVHSVLPCHNCAHTCRVLLAWCRSRGDICTARPAEVRVVQFLNDSASHGLWRLWIVKGREKCQKSYLVSEVPSEIRRCEGKHRARV